MFRELGQQMGMQTTRAIYSEDIDICINSAIDEKVREIVVKSTAASYSDKVYAQGVGVSPINALRTLYTNDIIQQTDITGDGTEVEPYNINIDNPNVMLYTGFQVSYDNKTIYDCRIIEPEKLGVTLRDFCNRPTKDAPIITIYANGQTIDCNIYTGRNNAVKPQFVKYLYIKLPAKVKYDEYDVEARVDCDLPEYLHSEIVTDAIRIYLATIGAIANDNKRNVPQND